MGRPNPPRKESRVYLSHHTHRAGISNSRLVGLDDNGATFCWGGLLRRGVGTRQGLHQDHDAVGA